MNAIVERNAGSKVKKPLTFWTTPITGPFVDGRPELASRLGNDEFRIERNDPTQTSDLLKDSCNFTAKISAIAGMFDRIAP